MYELFVDSVISRELARRCKITFRTRSNGVTEWRFSGRFHPASIRLDPSSDQLSLRIGPVADEHQADVTGEQADAEILESDISQVEMADLLVDVTCHYIRTERLLDCDAENERIAIELLDAADQSCDSLLFDLATQACVCVPQI